MKIHNLTALLKVNNIPRIILSYIKKSKFETKKPELIADTFFQRPSKPTKSPMESYACLIIYYEIIITFRKVLV